MSFTRTQEQEEICSAVSSGESTMVKALAGCAKSTTIIETLRDVPASRKTAILAFNAKIKKEMEDKISAAGLSRPNLTVKTMNGLGHAAIQKGLGPKLQLSKDKIFTLCLEAGLQGYDIADVKALVNAARSTGIVPKGTLGKGLVPDEDSAWEELAAEAEVDSGFIPVARRILTQSNKKAMAGEIDFDDQIYISTMVFGSYERFDLTFVDEAQDLSPLNHLQLRKAAAAQIVAVGDPHQAIYAWRGADSESMENMRALRDAWVDCSLSTTFRCPRLVVDRQRDFVPEFNAGPANLEGNIQSLATWTPTPDPESAVICRNNAPLIKLAFRLLRDQIPVNVVGRDIGAELKRLYSKISQRGSLPMQRVVSLLTDQLGDEDLDPRKADRLASLLEVLTAFGDLDKALDFLLKAREDGIALSTGHRSKGLEWNTVYHLEPQLIPNVYALAEGGPALQQEYNLQYVIETRTKNNLFFVNQAGLQ